MTNKQTNNNINNNHSNIHNNNNCNDDINNGINNSNTNNCDYEDHYLIILTLMINDPVGIKTTNFAAINNPYVATARSTSLSITRIEIINKKIDNNDNEIILTQYCKLHDYRTSTSINFHKYELLSLAFS